MTSPFEAAPVEQARGAGQKGSSPTADTAAARPDISDASSTEAGRVGASMAATDEGPTPAAPVEDAAAGSADPAAPSRPIRCPEFSAQYGKCQREPEHTGNHRNKDGETWA